MHDLIPGVHRWEAKVAAPKSRYQEDLDDTLKQAIFVGMLSKEYQDVIWQSASMTKELRTYENARDHIMNIVNQKEFK